jgi:8-oxo-dGTP diphosphatase
MMAPKRFEVGQKAFIERDGQVLIVFFPDGRLDFPGGRIEEGESDLIEALKREVREETTLEIEVGSPFASWLGRNETVYLVGYRCRYVTGEVTLSEEHIEYRWVDSSGYLAWDDGSPPLGALRRYFERPLP